MTMAFDRFKKRKFKEYLGHCEQKGFIYSIQKEIDEYEIVAVDKDTVTVLITYQIDTKGEEKK